MFLRNNTRAAAAICHHFRSAVTSGLSWLRAGGPRAALIQIQARVVASGGEPEPCVLMLTHLSPQHGALQGGVRTWGQQRLWVVRWFCSPLWFFLMNNRWDAHSLGSCAPAPTFIWVERIWVVFFPGPNRTPSCAGGIGSAVHAGPSSSVIFSLSAAAD